MIRNFIGLFLVAIVILIIFRFVLPYLNEKEHGCLVQKDVYLQRINSIVEKKFIDTPNHNLKKIIYLDENNNENEFVFIAEYKDMYDSLNVGDSIIKKQGTLLYRVRSKHTGKLSLFKFYTSCKDSVK